MTEPQPVHPLGNRATVLLCGVFGPYARDDEYGSRAINPMELYHNQVTRVQGGFSLRMFHRSFGLLLLQANIDAPCTLLDFPTIDRFVEELQHNRYDVVGISSIFQNVAKVKVMCELVRRHSPGSCIVVGGHVAGDPHLHEFIDADHVVKGEGVRWLQAFLGQDLDAPIRHPLVYAGFGTRVMGVAVPNRPISCSALLVPSVGCPVGCDFCCTSALFGGKGSFVNFYETGDELFSIMCQIEERMKVKAFFVVDENFLLHRKRALTLLELMERHKKSWSLYVFSSGRVLQSYTVEQLVRLGIAWVWIGLEGEDTDYPKLRGVNTRELVRRLRAHGISVLGSSMIGMETHTTENIDGVISYAVGHDTDFHQFMLYTACPGTPLYEECSRNGTLLPRGERSEADIHGQSVFNIRHPHIHNGEETEILLRAFERDFIQNGPSLVRLIRTTLEGWKKYRSCLDSRVRQRYARQGRRLATTYAGVVWAAVRYFRDEPQLVKRLATILRGIYDEFGWKTRILGPILGRVLQHTLKREERRLARGWTYEPPTFYEKNTRAIALENGRSGPRANDAAQSVTAEFPPASKRKPRSAARSGGSRHQQCDGELMRAITPSTDS